MFFWHFHDRDKRGHPFSHGLGVSMPRPFKKGIACHGSMHTLPFSSEWFVALYNDLWNCFTLYDTLAFNKNIGNDKGRFNIKIQLELWFRPYFLTKLAQFEFCATQHQSQYYFPSIWLADDFKWRRFCQNTWSKS